MRITPIEEFEMKVNPYSYAKCRAIARMIKQWPKRPPPRPGYLETEATRKFVSETRLIRAGDKSIGR